MFGIDKAIIKGWELESIQFEKLLSKTNVKIQTEGYTTVVIEYEDTTPVNVGYIKINDGNMFNTFQFGVKYTKGKRTIYGFIDMHISAYKGKTNNLKPLLLYQYHELITEVGEYLKDEYGIFINFMPSQFEMIELNKTIELDREFNEYKNILNLICLLAPKTYKDKDIKLDNRNNIKEIIISNNSVKCKIYDKTKQLLSVYKIIVDQKYMRIEYTLQGSKKIKSVFKGCGICELSDEAIKVYLIERIKKELINPLEKYIKISNKNLIKIAKEEKIKDSRRWTRAFVLRAMSEKTQDSIPVLVCIEQLKSIIKKETKRNYARTLKNLEKDFERGKDFSENFLKLEELKNKILN